MLKKGMSSVYRVQGYGTGSRYSYPIYAVTKVESTGLVKNDEK